MIHQTSFNTFVEKHFTNLFYAFIAFYLVANLIHYFFFDPYPAVDYVRYQRHSDLLLNQQYSNPNIWYYIAYTAIVALFKGIGLGLNRLYLFQILVSVSSLFLLGDYLNKKFSPKISLAFVLVFSLQFSIWKWNYSLMTESLFISMGMLLISQIGYFLQDKKRKQLAWISLIVLFMALMRQHGWQIFVLTFLFLAWQEKLYKNRLIVIASAVLLFFFILNFGYFYHVIKGQSFAHFNKGTIIWGLKSWTYPCSDGDYQNIPFLFFSRILVELSGIRPYFSMANNVISALFWIPFNALVFVSVFRNYRNPLAFFCALIYIFQLLSVGITYADWEGRFGYQIFPFSLFLFVLNFQYFNKTKMP